MLAWGQLDIARGEASKFGRAQDARRLNRGCGANDDLRNDIARAGAQEIFNGVGHQLGVDGALRVERHCGLGCGLGIGPGVNRGGANAVRAQLVEECFSEMVQTAFDGGRDGATRGGAVAIPAQDNEVPLLFAEPGERDARQRNRREQADVEALGQIGDRGIEQ